eukprot:CAMPEP_0115760502 /NCGR_PEP_ID=MMETSP0272-20121206/100028_1 /TAXON_ID=71861 /ORGANISM="Scrippsiella trochoidea, Strain CCMP3099" /LENGTH=181 /DNA_ID=CAMNT_0003206161 /DNA_START=232 /DNA_END=775 /DNA_ORIENTATION=-
MWAAGRPYDTQLEGEGFEALKKLEARDPHVPIYVQDMEGLLPVVAILRVLHNSPNKAPCRPRDVPHRWQQLRGAASHGPGFVRRGTQRPKAVTPIEDHAGGRTAVEGQTTWWVIRARRQAAKPVMQSHLHLRRRLAGTTASQDAEHKSLGVGPRNERPSATHWPVAAHAQLDALGSGGIQA